MWCSGANAVVHGTVSFSSLVAMSAACRLAVFIRSSSGRPGSAQPAAAARSVAPPIGMAASLCELAGRLKRDKVASRLSRNAQNGGQGCSGGCGALRGALQRAGGAASGSTATGAALQLLPCRPQPARWAAAEVGLGNGLVRRRGGPAPPCMALVGPPDHDAPSRSPAGWRHGGRRRRCRRRPRWKSRWRRMR